MDYEDWGWNIFPFGNKRANNNLPLPNFQYVELNLYFCATIKIYVDKSENSGISERDRSR